MNRDDVLRLAKEAGVDAWWDSGDENRDVLQDHLERFAALVAAHVKASDGAVTNEGAKVDVQPVAWIKKDRSSIEVSIMSSEYMVNLGFEPLYTHPPAADVQELVEALKDLLYQAKLSEDEGGWDFEQAQAALKKWEGK